MLPIEPILPQLAAALRDQTAAVLVAPPGAGKTTRVPLALLAEPWLNGGRILMLEPRRLAARAAARYMAASLGEAVGETVGYRVRLESRVGLHTRIEVITEGILTRMLQDDPALEGVGLVIFDEFHERSLHADLGLALTLQSQAVLRPDLRILVMSATLEAEPVAALLGGAPVLTSPGRSYPVETRYLSRRHEGPVEPLVVQTVLAALEQEPGDILVFLPGAGEIRRVEAGLQAAGLPAKVRVAPLYGNLSHAAQDQALLPAPPGERKVVLATAIAETSLTGEGVRVVVDSGLMRVARFSPRTGMTRLETIPVSRAAADQRRGRAGRLGPGVCYRLWTEQEHQHLLPHNRPEILEADLAPLALELAAWGESDPVALRRLDSPPAAALAQARELLRDLGALDAAGGITPHGRQMVRLGLHPRLAHMVLQAIPLGLGRLACELAALLSERDILRGGPGGPARPAGPGGLGGPDGQSSRGGPATPDADLRLRVEALRRCGAKAPEAAGGGREVVDAAACRRIRAEARHWMQVFGIPCRDREACGSGADNGGGSASNASGAGNGIATGSAIHTGHADLEACGLLLAYAYPDRISQRRSDGRFLMRNGRGAVLPGPQPLGSSPYLVAAELDDQGPESRIYLAAPIDLPDLLRHFGHQGAVEELVAWDRAAQTVRARRRERLGALVLKEAPLPDPDPEAVVAALLQGIAQEGLEILPWDRAARQLQQRMIFMAQLEPGWPDVSDPALVATLADWLAPHLYGLRSRDDLQRLRLAGILEGLLSWEQRRELDQSAPTHLVVPSGSRIAIDYSDPTTPVLAVRIQELFGLRETPAIARGRVPLTLHLLSPAHRPVQVTRDLAGFWQNTYFEVRKELRGRYPKHHWPDDPLHATPTRHTRPRS